MVEEGVEVILVEFDRGVGIASFDEPTPGIAWRGIFKAWHTGNSVGRNQRHLDSALERSLRLRQKSPARCRSVFLGSVSSSKLYSLDFVGLKSGKVLTSLNLVRTWKHYRKRTGRTSD